MLIIINVNKYYIKTKLTSLIRFINGKKYILKNKEKMAKFILQIQPSA